MRPVLATMKQPKAAITKSDSLARVVDNHTTKKPDRVLVTIDSDEDDDKENKENINNNVMKQPQQNRIKTDKIEPPPPQSPDFTPKIQAAAVTEMQMDGGAASSSNDDKEPLGSHDFDKFFDHEDTLLSRSSYGSNESFHLNDHKPAAKTNYEDHHHQHRQYRYEDYYHAREPRMVNNWGDQESESSDDYDDDDVELDYDLIKEWLDNKEYKIDIRSSKIVDWSRVNNPNRINSGQFASMVFVVETFNKVLLNMYKLELFPRDPHFAPITINDFACSLLNDSSSNSQQKTSLLERVVFYLIRIMFYLNNRQFVDQFTWFGLKTESLFKVDWRLDHTAVIAESPVISLEILAQLCVKITTRVSFNHKDHSTYLVTSDTVGTLIQPLINELNSVDSVNQLSVGHKLDLCECLIEGIMSSKRHNVSVDSVYKPRVNKLLDEIERLERKVSTGMYSYSTGMYNYYRMGEVRRTKQLIKLKERELAALARIESFASLNVTDQLFSFHFWTYDSWPSNLVVEKRFSPDQREYQESEWFVINDLTRLEEIVQLFEHHLNASSLAISLRETLETMRQQNSATRSPPVKRSVFDFVHSESVLRREFASTTASPICLSLCQKRSSHRLTRSLSFSGNTHSDQVESIHHPMIAGSFTHMIVLDEFIHLKDQLTSSSFIDCKVLFDQTSQRQLIGYETSPIYQELEASLKSDYEALLSGEDFVPKMKTCLKLLYDCLSKKCLEIKFCQEAGGEKNWLVLCERAQTVNQLHMLLQVLERNIKWRLSREETVCAICERAVNKTSNNKECCSKCNVEFHLECLTQNTGSKAKTAANHHKQQQPLVVFKWMQKLFCAGCKNEDESLMETKRQELQLQFEQQNQSNSIEVNKYKLRLVKNRIEKMVVDEEVTRPKRAKSTRAATNEKKKKKKEEDEETITTTTDSAASTIVKRTRGGKRTKRYVELSEDENDDEDNYVSPKKKVAQQTAAAPVVEHKYSLRTRKM